MSKFVCEYCGGPMLRCAKTDGGIYYRCTQAAAAYEADLNHHRQNLDEKYRDHLRWIKSPWEAQQRLEETG